MKNEKNKKKEGVENYFGLSSMRLKEILIVVLNNSKNLCAFVKLPPTCP